MAKEFMDQHGIREYTFFILFETLVRSIPEESLEAELEDLYATTEELVEIPVPEEVREKAKAVLSHAEEFDTIIAGYSKKRTLNRIPAVTRSILRIALYELNYCVSEKLPVNVIISEAVKLSQAYAYDEDTSFLNGVLGNYVRDTKKAQGAKEN